jgi:hypothetical protein
MSMQVTEENITNWELDEEEIKSLIHLTKLEIKRCEGDNVTQTYYGLILGKLLIMKYGKQDQTHFSTSTN